MTVYARLRDFKAQAGGIVRADDDDAWLRLLDQSSREIDQWCGVRFAPEVATAYFEGSGNSRLLLHDRAEDPYRGQLITMTTCKLDTTGDATYDVTLTENTHVWKRRKHSGDGYAMLEINDYNPPWYIFPRRPRSVQIVGTFGAWAGVTGTVATLDDADGVTASETSLTVDDGHTVEVGDTLVVGTEDVFVTNVGPTRLVVERGVNGTTAATHANNATFTRRTYPPDIEMACVKLAILSAWQSQSGYDAEVGGRREQFLRVLDQVQRWRMVR